jgi:tRNA nucleotidyltransferase (CCA-adding enzyme)
MQKDLQGLMRDPNLLPFEKQTLLSNIAGLAASMNMPCYLVGGVVRDLLLGESVKDLDVLVEGDAIKLGEMLVKKHGGKLLPHTKFRTAIWHLPDSLSLTPNRVDLITARSETYERPGALPAVVPASVDEDLRRRDFAINAMALRIDGDCFGELLDPLAGQRDLELKLIRALHPRSFLDDPTRIFRALRYEGRYSFRIEAETLKWINPESLNVIPKLSGERIRHELDLIFEEKNFHAMMLRAGQLDLFRWIHPKLPAFDRAHADLLDIDPALGLTADRPTIGYMLWLMNLPKEAIISIGQRLDFSTELTYSVWAVAQLKNSLPFLANSKPSVWTYAVEKLPLLSIYIVFLVSGERSLLSYISVWRHVKPHTTGDDLKARGLPAGSRYTDILTSLRAAWLDGDVKNDKEEEQLLETLL